MSCASCWTTRRLCQRLTPCFHFFRERGDSDLSKLVNTRHATDELTDTFDSENKSTEYIYYSCLLNIRRDLLAQRNETFDDENKSTE